MDSDCKLQRRVCMVNHWLSHVELFIGLCPLGGRGGFVYAGETVTGLVKVGKTIKQCPLCRMDQNRLDYLGLVWVSDAFVFEQKLIAAMGEPIKGHEWFDGHERIRGLISDGWLHDVYSLNIRLCVLVG